MAKKTILDAVVEALRGSKGPRSAADLHSVIVERNLYEFHAKDAVGVVRSAVRKHLKNHGGAGQPPAVVRAVGGDCYELP